MLATEQQALMTGIAEPGAPAPALARRPGLVFAGNAALVALIAVLDYVTGYDVRLATLYLFPIALATWRLGAGAGTFMAVASTLSAGRGGAVKQITVEPTPPEKGLYRAKDELPEPYQREVAPHIVLDGDGKELSRSDRAEAVFRTQTNAVLSSAGADADTFPTAVKNLRLLAVASGVPRVYVRNPVTQELVEAGTFVHGLGDHEVTLSGGSPVELSVSFPRPRVGKVEHSSESEMTQGWLRSLLNMPVQHAVVWADSDACSFHISWHTGKRGVLP